MAEEHKEEKKDVVYFNDALIVEEPQQEAEVQETAANDEKVEAKAEEAAEVKVEDKKAEVEEKAPPKNEFEERVQRLEAELKAANEKLEKAVKKEEPPVGEVKTLEEMYDEEFINDPKNAMKNLLARKELLASMKRDLTHTQNVVVMATEGKIPGWEDFKDLVPEVASLAEEYKPFVRPEFGGHVKLVELLAWAARGKKLTYEGLKAKEAAEKAEADKKAKEEAAKAKSAVFMESSATGVSTGKGEISVEDFAKLPLEEMRKLYQYMDQ